MPWKDFWVIVQGGVDVLHSLAMSFDALIGGPDLNVDLK
jgi:hypothetical protein